MSEDFKKTVKIVRGAKVGTDEKGQTVWTGPVETAELELVSTAMLKRIIDSGDEERKQRLEEAAQGKDGILAHDRDTDRFEIIDEDDLQAALEGADNAPDATGPAGVTYELLGTRGETDEEELSLVSTQALRRVLDKGEESVDREDEPEEKGFDPYNSG